MKNIPVFLCWLALVGGQVNAYTYTPPLEDEPTKGVGDDRALKVYRTHHGREYQATYLRSKKKGISSPVTQAKGKGGRGSKKSKKDSKKGKDCVGKKCNRKRELFSLTLPISLLKGVMISLTIDALYLRSQIWEKGWQKTCQKS